MTGNHQDQTNQSSSHAAFDLNSFWETLLKKDAVAWEEYRATSLDGQSLLIATSVGGHIATTMIESMLAVAMSLRRSRVDILLCDEVLPACMFADQNSLPNQEDFVMYGPSKHLCMRCFPPALKMYRSMGLTVHRYSDFISEKERDTARQLSLHLPIVDIADYRLDGVAVGEHALAGALRFFARGDLNGEPYGESILRRYLNASLLTTYMCRRLLNTHQYEVTCFNHGIYVPLGLVGEIARQQNVRVVNWNPAYKKKCFIFSHHDTYHHTLINEPTANWENIILTSTMEAELLAYLKSRWYGTGDWIWFHEDPQDDPNVIAAEIGIDFSKPCIGMLTSVMWDAKLHYSCKAFPDMLDWVFKTITYFVNRPELQLIIRVHPAEIRGSIPSRQPLVKEIERAFPSLPDNVFVIPPESKVSTYAVMEKCNSVIIYNTKSGIEISSIGIPVIVSGEAWIRNKGFSLDATSPEQYFKLLDQLPLKTSLSDRLTQRARKYAYHFFFRRMIPLSFMQPTNDWPPYRFNISRLEHLMPGQDSGLDLICDGISKATEFIYPGNHIH